MRSDRAVDTASGDRALEALNRVAAAIENLDEPLSDFFGRLSSTVAGLVRARRAGFFLLTGEALSLQDRAFGIEADLAAASRNIPCRSGGSDALDRVVFGGEAFRTRGGPASADVRPYLRWLAAMQARTAAAVPWSVGDTRIGLVAVFDSEDPEGFSDADLQALRASALTAAIVWQQRGLAEQLRARTPDDADHGRELAQKMTQLEITKRHILNLAAHELRGPITVIRGYLSMVEDASLDLNGMRRILPILMGKVGQMDALVTQMLEVARLDEGRVELSIEDLDLGLVSRKVVDVAGLLAPAGVSILLERSPAPVVVRADAHRIATIIGNLLDNAIKYSPDGGLVRCSVGVEGGRAYVRVADQGLGIAAADMPRLFSRFGRILTAENSHIGGTGLGLHVSKELAELHGGDIVATSEPGAGSTFCLWLPLPH